MTERKFTDEQIIEALEVRMPHDAICREAYDLIMRQRAEIERLNSCREMNISSIATLHRQLLTAKAEAIKEFAERLKAAFPDKNDPHFTADDAFTLNYIDYLVEEMTEVKEQ